jgi:hypothetical protein
MSTTREFLPKDSRRRERTPEQVAAAAPGFDYPATQVGTNGNITVYYDSALGTQGLAQAKQLLQSAPGPYSDMAAFFGIAGSSVNLVVAPLSGNNDGSGGAYHYGCDFTNGGTLYLDATFASTKVDPLDLLIGLYVAELSESFMGAAGKGWGCGSSNGEGLSRFCAELDTTPGTLDAFATGASWAQAGYPDWVSKTEATDQDSVSTGCAIVYLYWLGTLNYKVPQIVQAGGATLSANYKALTGKTTAYQDLVAAAKAKGVTSDNPFAHLWHTLRRADGTWTGLGDVQGQFKVPGPIKAVTACAGAPGETQFMFTTFDGHLWHTLRRADGSWTGLGDVQGQFGIPGPVQAVAACAGAPGETQFMFTTTDGHLWHTLRRADGSWTGLGDVQGQFQIPGPVKAVAAATGANGETQFMFTTRDGHLWHTLRRADGSWTGLGDVQGQFSIPGPVEAVGGCGGAPGETQFMFTTTDGHLWHTLRRADGSWTGLGDVQGQFKVPSPVRTVAAATGASEETQFMFTTADGHLWHTLRRANGTWTGLGDVVGQFAIPGAVRAVSGTSGAPSETQFMFTT